MWRGNVSQKLQRRSHSHDARTARTSDSPSPIMPHSQKGSSDSLGYVPLSRRRTDRRTKILLGLLFLGGIVVGYVLCSNADGLGPKTSALDNYQRMCVLFFVLLMNVVV